MLTKTVNSQEKKLRSGCEKASRESTQTAAASLKRMSWKPWSAALNKVAAAVRHEKVKVGVREKVVNARVANDAARNQNSRVLGQLFARKGT